MVWEEALKGVRWTVGDEMNIFWPGVCGAGGMNCKTQSHTLTEDL